MSVEATTQSPPSPLQQPLTPPSVDIKASKPSRRRRRAKAGVTDGLSSSSSNRKRKLEKLSAEVSDSEDEERSADPSAAKRRRKRKARRARRKPYKGYYEMTERERARLEERSKMRAEKFRERMRAKGHMLAPYNSTEFIILDHESDAVNRINMRLSADSDSLAKQSPQKIRQRGRDSSFSLEDDDEDYFYSSPEDEEAFISKEFSKDYENGHLDRLEHMEKDDLIQEYLSMEKKLESLEKRLEEINHRETMKALTGEVDYEFHRGEVPMEPETAAKIKVFQTEISRLARENAHLGRENAALNRKLVRSAVSDSSSSSSSDSGSSSSEDSSSSSEDSSSSSDESEEEEEKRGEEVRSSTKEKQEKEDTGYESTQSKEETPEPS